MANVVLNPDNANAGFSFIESVLDLIKVNTSDYVADSATAAHIASTSTGRSLAFTGTGLNTGSGVITGFDFVVGGTTAFTVKGLDISASDIDALSDSFNHTSSPDVAGLLSLFEGIGWNIDFTASTQFGVRGGTGGNDIMNLGSGTDFVFLDGGNDDIDLGGGDDIVYYIGDLHYQAAGEVHIDGGSGHDILYFTEPSTLIVPEITEGMTIDLSQSLVLPHFTITTENVEQIAGTRFADIFIGTNAADEMGGAGGGDELTGRGGKDTLYGSTDDEDVFIYLKASDSVGAKRDIIEGYEHNMDFFDLSALHPDTKNDKFTLVGEGPLRKAGDLHFIQHSERGHENDYTLIEANIDKKGKPDLQIEIHDLVDLTGGDFAL